jgi:hypothetical protein
VYEWHYEHVRILSYGYVKSPRKGSLLMQLRLPSANLEREVILEGEKVGLDLIK